MAVHLRKTILFYRNFKGFTGGHLKVWHYFMHCFHSSIFSPKIYLTPDSLFNKTNPWSESGQARQPEWQPEKAAALFIAGLDWHALSQDTNLPIINLIQHVRHGDPDDPRRPFLSRRAIRICVSKEVEESILCTGKVNGPVVTIPACLDPTANPAPPPMRDIPVLIAGLKRPELAKTLASRLLSKGLDVLCQVERLSRNNFLDLLARSRVAILLPNNREGFYLPALEAMQMGTLLICPDCVGNRSFCIDGTNCYCPPYYLDDLEASLLKCLECTPLQNTTMLAAALQTAAAHQLERERSSFLEILDHLDSLWIESFSPTTTY